MVTIVVTILRERGIPSLRGISHRLFVVGGASAPIIIGVRKNHKQQRDTAPSRVLIPHGPIRLIQFPQPSLHRRPVQEPVRRGREIKVPRQHGLGPVLGRQYGERGAAFMVAASLTQRQRTVAKVEY